MRKSAIRLFSSDLDGTLLGDRQAAAEFLATWEAIPRGVRPLLVYNTGRTVHNVLELVARRALPAPDYILGSVGTELHSALYDHGVEFSRRLGFSWDLECVEQIVRRVPEVRPQACEFIQPFKSSWYWTSARSADLQQLKRDLSAAGVKAHVDYSCRYFLDVVPAEAGKGNALSWLASRLGISLPNVLVAGDTGNDLSMFMLPEIRGVVVGNALPELSSEARSLHVLHAGRQHAGAVLEGLQHFGVIR